MKWCSWATWMNLRAKSELYWVQGNEATADTSSENTGLMFCWRQCCDIILDTTGQDKLPSQNITGVCLSGGVQALYLSSGTGNPRWSQAVALQKKVTTAAKTTSALMLSYTAAHVKLLEWFCIRIKTKSMQQRNKSEDFHYSMISRIQLVFNRHI